MIKKEDITERLAEKTTQAGIVSVITGLGAITHFNEAADVAQVITDGVAATATGGWVAGILAVVTGIFGILYKKK